MKTSKLEASIKIEDSAKSAFKRVCEFRYSNRCISPNQTGGMGGEMVPLPWYVLFYKILVIHPNFIKFGNFS